MFELIVIRFNRRGPSNQAEVIVTPEQQTAILAEFQQEPDWIHFVAYCDRSLSARSDPLDSRKVGTFVDPFEPALATIIRRHVEYNTLVFWSVLDALHDEHLATRR